MLSGKISKSTETTTKVYLAIARIYETVWLNNNRDEPWEFIQLERYRKCDILINTD